MELDLEEYEIDTGNESPTSHSIDKNEGTNTENDTDFTNTLSTPISIRKPIPKLDAARFLNKHRGYPVLLEKLKGLKYKGKGRERQYLEAYMVTYQLWSNRLWPKAKLDDFMIMARNASKTPEIRKYCRELIEREKEIKMFGYVREEKALNNENLASPQAIYDDSAAIMSSTEETSNKQKRTTEEPIPESLPITEEHMDIPDNDELAQFNDDEMAAELYAEFDF